MPIRVGEDIEEQPLPRRLPTRRRAILLGLVLVENATVFNVWIERPTEGAIVVKPAADLQRMIKQGGAGISRKFYASSVGIDQVYRPSPCRLDLLFFVGVDHQYPYANFNQPSIAIVNQRAHSEVKRCGGNAHGDHRYRLLKDWCKYVRSWFRLRQLLKSRMGSYGCVWRRFSTRKIMPLGGDVKEGFIADFAREALRSWCAARRTNPQAAEAERPELEILREEFGAATRHPRST